MQVHFIRIFPLSFMAFTSTLLPINVFAVTPDVEMTFSTRLPIIPTNVTEFPATIMKGRYA